MNHLLQRSLAPLLCVLAPWAHAQLIDDVDLRREGENAVLQVRFVTPVQYRRSVATRSGDVIQAYYDVVAARSLPPLVVTERRIAARGAMPEIVLTDDAAGGRDSLGRRVVVRLSKPTPLRVRAGRGNQSIEIVLEGLGAALTSAMTAAMTAAAPAAPAEPPPAAPAPGRFQIALAQSSTPGFSLDKPIPKSLERLQVFTGQREVGGRTVHEVSVGYFDTLAEAEAARQTLLPRFPAAVVVALAAPAAPAPATPGAPDIEAQAAALLAAAKAADAQHDDAFALARLNELLNLPPTAVTREAQELVGHVRLRSGDVPRARAEYETFLKLYPAGTDAERVRQALRDLPDRAVAGAPRKRAPIQPSSTLTGSVSEFFYGGASKVRTQEFQDSSLSGLPQLASDNVLSGTDLQQLMTNVDVNWRYRDVDTDMRFVFRDAYTADLLRKEKSRNRLSALYFEHRSLLRGTSIKLGRQSPTGGGVLGRFDGVQAGYTFVPKWRINAVVGQPTDKLLDSKRHFYGASLDAEALTPNISGSLYVHQQMIDSQIDRRAVGTELRYFSSNASLSGTLDYDQMIRGLNIASLQGTWQSAGNTVVNILFDQRATPMLMLGNALFFGTAIPSPTATDPNATRMATSIRDLLANGYLPETLRESVAATTTKTTQGLMALTTPISPNWQIGGDIRVTNLGAIPSIPIILPNGQGRSDNQGVGAQLIGTNLYSSRDTHVIGLSALRGSSQFLDPSLGTQSLRYTGQLLSYNNSSQVNENWLLEPSLKFYNQTDSGGVKTARVSPGLRVTYRAAKQVSVESEVSGEYSKTSGPNRSENSNRVFYYLGSRYDF
ncbi:MAG: tetratricopeptide repeat protein [Burkholderiales bacterium]